MSYLKGSIKEILLPGKGIANKLFDILFIDKYLFCAFLAYRTTRIRRFYAVFDEIASRFR